MQKIVTQWQQLQFTDLFSGCNSAAVNFEELARCTDDFNGAQCKAVCVEAVSIYEIYTL